MKAIKSATAKVILETRVQDKKGFHPVKLRVTFSGKHKYYVLHDNNGVSRHLSPENFERANTNKEIKNPTDEKKDRISSDDRKDLHLLFRGKEQKAVDVINKLPLFTFEAFERLYFGVHGDGGDVLVHITNKAKTLRSEGRISTAVLYECTNNSLELFNTGKKLRFERVNVAFLNKYDAWMVKQGNSLTTIGMYTRCIRAAFNEAIRSGEVKDIPYPFGKGGYQPPTGANVKKALEQKDVVRIANYKPAIPGTAEERYRDLWLFSFLCNGINLKDVLRLQYKNIDGDVIRLIRAKTQRENRSRPRLIEIIITKPVGRIIDRWGVKPGLPDSYIFGFLTPDMTPDQEYKKIQDVVKRVNNAMESISEALELPMKVTSYGARHSFATILKRSGASMEFIAESMGHTGTRVLESHYVDTYEISEKRKWAETLLQDSDKDVNKI